MLERFSKVSNLNIIVIGDIILDKYINGVINRMSAEAPIPIVDKTSCNYVLGGSANVATNLKSLGANPILIGTIGDDKNGNRIIELLNNKNLTTKYLLKTTKTTTVKTRFMVDDKQIFRYDNEDTTSISITHEQLIIDYLNQIIKTIPVKGIIFQDYNKGVFRESLIKRIIHFAKLSNITTFVDPKFDNYWDYKEVDYFKPNKKEIFSALGNDSISIEDAMHKTKSKLKCNNVICTLAEDGINILNDSNFIEGPTQKIDVVDVSGAGDSTMAMIAISALLGYNSKEIIQLSNAAGRASCLKYGVSTISLTDIHI